MLPQDDTVFVRVTGDDLCTGRDVPWRVYTFVVNATVGVCV